MMKKENFENDLRTIKGVRKRRGKEKGEDSLPSKLRRKIN